MSRRLTLLGNDLRRTEVLEDVDDETEKRKRNTRHSIINSEQNISIRSKRHTRTTTLINQENDGQLTPLAKPSNEQLSCLYNSCIKLLNENKINSKNAFQLKLIDYLGDIVLNKEINGGDTNFQVVGFTIDAGSKIYAARVDALHHNTYQMLSGLGKQDENGEQNMDVNQGDDPDGGGDGVGGDQEGDDAQRQQKAKRKRVKKSTQLIENLEQITSKLNEDDFIDDDLYFTKISQSTEHEATEGLLLNKLKFKDDSLDLLINKDDIYFDLIKPNPDEINTKNEVNIKTLCDYAQKCDLINAKICDDLSKFRFLGWNLDTNDDLSKLCENMAAADNENDNDDLEQHRFDNNLRALDTQQMQQLAHVDQVNSRIMDDADIDVDIDDDIGMGGQHDNSGHQNITTSHHNINDINSLNLEKFDDVRSLQSVAELTQLLSTTGVHSDYSYFNFDRLKLHDLPKHLKVIALKLSAANKNFGSTAGVVNSSQMSQQQQQQQQQQEHRDKRKKEVPKLDLSIQIDRTKFFKVTKKAIYLSDRTIEKRLDKCFNLETERELNYNARELFQPYHKQIIAKYVNSDTDFENIDNLLTIENNNLNRTLLANGQINGGDNDNPCVGSGVGGGDDDMPVGGDFDDMMVPTATGDQFYTQNGGEFQLLTQQQTQQQANNFDSQAQMLEGDYLVKAPEQVNALNIEYAKKAKCIDAKKLKTVLWSLILDESNDKENTDNTANETNNDKSQQPFTKINCTLRNVYKRLRPPLINKIEFEDLSVSIVFQMLLFLANEHSLSLKHNQDGSDLYITNAIEVVD